jgi:hypothetical protein
MSNELSLPAALAGRTVDAIVDRLSLREVHGSDGGPLMTLVSQMGPAPVGQVRVFTGDVVDPLVTVSLAVPAIGLDSHMLFAFTRADSAVPHFTVDSVFAGGSYAFHLDLIPRVDLGASLAYMNAAYQPLSETCTAARGHDGLSPAALGPRQLALMSPWMLAHRADEAAFRTIDRFVDRYRDHWFALVEGGLPDDAMADVDPARLADRDRRNRAALFDPEVDPVWAQVGRLIGEPTAAEIRTLLREGRR